MGLNGKAKDDRLLIGRGQIRGLEMLNFLIDLGFDVHAVRSYGNLLHVTDEEDILHRLIELGVDLEATDDDGLTPVCVNPSLLTILKPGSVNTKVTDRKGNSILQRYFLNDENADVFKAGPIAWSRCQSSEQQRRDHFAHVDGPDLQP